MINIKKQREPSFVTHHFANGSAVAQWLKHRTLDHNNPNSYRVLPCQIMGQCFSLNITSVHSAV